MWMSLGKVIGSTAFLAKPYNPTITYHNYNNNIISPPILNALATFTSFKSRSFSHLSQLGEYYPEIEDRKLEVEAKAGSDSNPVMVESIHTNKGNELEVHKMDQSIQKGDIINLRDLLFTKSRDYLVKYKDNQQVKAELLAGKVVFLYFVPLCCDSDWETSFLVDLYNDLQPNHGFEIVLVVASDFDANCSEDDFDANCSEDLPHDFCIQRDCQKCFDEIFSNMPWTAVPYSDKTCRNHLQRSFGVTVTEYMRSKIFVVDSSGMVLQCPGDLSNSDKDLYILEAYGASGYPFSDERIKFLKAEDDAVAKNPSLQTLLGSPQRDYLISNKGDMVPIHTLEDKVVALFFYEADGAHHFAEKLKMAYIELKRMKKNFEVVLIYISKQWTGFIEISIKSQKGWYCEIEESFWQDFKAMPWLALPFKDSNVERLKRIFEFDPRHFRYMIDQEPPNLVMFGPRGEFIEPYGRKILERSNIQAYPFTREKAAMLETEKLKNLKMEMLWDPSTVFRGNDGTEVPFSQIVGKKVILYFQNPKSHANIWRNKTEIKFLQMLKERYLQLKGTGDGFEVIHIFFDKIECSLTKHIGDLPWLVSHASKLLPTVNLHPYLCYKEYFFHFCDEDKIFSSQVSPILAFDGDGRVVRKSVGPAFESMDFPFYDGSLKDEILSELVIRSGWEHSKFPDGGRIYSR